MLGAIVGDILGSVYERNPIKTTDFPFWTADCTFTDDTVLTVAVADALLSGQGYTESFRAFYHAFPKAGYGGSFRRWAQAYQPEPYGSWGNGSAMRVSPIGWWHNTLEETLW